MKNDEISDGNSINNSDNGLSTSQISRLHTFPSKAVEELLLARKNEGYTKLIQELLSEVTVIDNTLPARSSVDYRDGIENKNTNIYGKSIVFTGRLEKSNRKVAESICGRLGGVPLSTVTKGVSFVVSGGIQSSSKVEKAKKLGIKVIDEDEWIEMCGGEETMSALMRNH